MQCGGVCVCVGGGARGKAACQVKRSRRLEKHLFMLAEIFEREERGDLFASKVAVECERKASR